MFVYVVAAFPKGLTVKQVEKAVGRCATKFGLRKTLELYKPLFSHWHWQRPEVSGRPEVTFEKQTNQIKVIVHKHRTGADGWAKQLAPHLAAELAQALTGKTYGNVGVSYATHRH